MTDRQILDVDPRRTDPARQITAADDALPGQTPEGDPEAASYLAMDEATAAKKLTKLWDDQSKLPAVQQREAEWECNTARRAGYAGVRIMKDENKARYRVRYPFGGKSVEFFNKARTNCRIFVGNLLADPPAPLCEPPEGGDIDDNDTSQRALLDLQSEDQLNTPGKVRDALDTSCTSIGYVVYDIDDTAGGQMPKEIEASPLAQSAMAPLTNPATGLPYADPVTGEVPPPVLRYVAKDGQTLTDDQTQAALVWRRGLRSEVMDGFHVRTVPHTADVFAATGLLVAAFKPWGQLKRQFRDQLGDLTPEERKELFAYQPTNSDNLLPDGWRAQDDGDDALVFVLKGVFVESPDEPEGACVVVVGGKKVVWRKPWVSYQGGTREALMLPASMFKLYRNGDGENPCGTPLMSDLGAMNEIIAAMHGHYFAWMDKWQNMPVFLGAQTSIEPRELSPAATYLRYHGAKPEALQPPAFPSVATDMLERAEAGSDRAAHINEASDLLNKTDSGRQAYQVVAQAHVQLAEPQQNTTKGYVRCSRVELQLSRAFGVEGEARWRGEDGAFLVRKWKGSDLSANVRLRPGTLTMLAPTYKAQIIDAWAAAGRISNDDAADWLSSNLNPLVGRQDNPWRLEVKRSLNKWLEGPPEGFDQQVQQASQAAAQQAGQMAQQQAQAMAMQPPPMAPAPMPGMPPAPPVDPAAIAQQAAAQAQQQMVAQVQATVFPPGGHHALPMVAQLRVTELARVMATTKFWAQPPEWRQVVEMEFQRCAQLAAPPTPQPAAPGAPGEPPAPGGAVPPMDNPALTGKAA